ncbi:hypothetical protein Leryth_019462 [Lithospermum erythrorhizon]|nr:hypothetical protein Leryth_019462 [Lithospermum erythrorhizon]
MYKDASPLAFCYDFWRSQQLYYNPHGLRILLRFTHLQQKMSESISGFVQSNVDGVEMVQIVSSARKRWLVAIQMITDPRRRFRLVAAIHMANEKNSLSRKVSLVTENQNELHQTLLPSRSFVVNVEPEAINPTLLSEIVQEKNIELLHRCDGVEGVVSALRTDKGMGIQGDLEDLANRRQIYGSNIFQRPRPTTWKIMLEKLKEAIIVLLILCATLAIGYGIKKYGLRGCREGGTILVAILLVITVTALSKVWSRRQLYQVSRSFDAIPIEVIRNGQMQKLPLLDAVVGDIIVLETGYQVPADGLWVDGDSLKVDESTITAEVDPIEVDYEHNPFLLSGTMVVNGSARMIVTAVGMNTKWGKLMNMKHSDSSEKTQLYAKSQWITNLISKVGLITSFLALLVLVARFTAHIHHANGVSLPNVIVSLLAPSIAIAAASIPDGLLLAVIITLGYSVKRLAAENVFVRNLTACEAIGDVMVICTSITGSMTSENPIVVKVWLGPKAIGEEEMPSSKLESEIEEVLCDTISSNNTTPFENVPNISSNLTEKAVDEWYAQNIGMDINQLIEISFQEAETSKLEIAGSVLFPKKVDDSVHLLKRGAPLFILNECSHHYDRNREIKDIDDGLREKLQQIIQNMETSCFHCVAFAHKRMTCLSDHEDITRDDGSIREKYEDENFNLLGFVGVSTRCRLEAKQALGECELAGVHIKIITKENLNVARETAALCGIVDLNQIVDGEVFRSYDNNERLAKADTIRMVVRANSLDKNLMVTTLKEQGHVVAVVGDSMSDSSALREADVGICLGTEGADIVKGSSDIIILDDSFASVVKILRWGRCIYHNIQIFTQYQITAFIVSLVIDFETTAFASVPPTINVVTAISSGKVPYATIQILWVKLIVGLLAALALSVEQPSEDLMKRRPVNWKQPFITSIMWRDILVQALYQIIILLTIQFKGKSIFNLNSGEKDTIIFNIFVLCQIFLIFTTRMSEKNVFKTLRRRKLFWAIVGTIALIQFFLIELLNRVSNTERLNWKQWALCVGVSSLCWPIGCVLDAPTTTIRRRR